MAVGLPRALDGPPPWARAGGSIRESTRALHGPPPGARAGRGSVRERKRTRVLTVLIAMFLLGIVSLRGSAQRYTGDGASSSSSQAISVVAKVATAAAEMATAKETGKREAISPAARAATTAPPPSPSPAPGAAAATSKEPNADHDPPRGEAQLDSDWKNYQLGDWVLGGGAAGTDRPRFNETLAWQYSLELARRSDGKHVGKGMRPNRYDREVFCDVVETRAQESYSTAAAAAAAALPQPGDVVLHLRLGDVLDEQMLLEEVEDAFEHGVSIVPSQIRQMIKRKCWRKNGGTRGWWHYVKGKCYYENVFQKIEQIEEERTGAASAAARLSGKSPRLIVVGSAVHQQYAGKNRMSLRYTELVRRFAEERGYKVVVRVGAAAPDDDLVWMTRAPFFVEAGGGFSKLTADCVERRGGVALRSSGERGRSPLEEPCWTAPRPLGAAGNYSWEAGCWFGKGGQWSGTRNFPPEETVWK